MPETDSFVTGLDLQDVTPAFLGTQVRPEEEKLSACPKSIINPSWRSSLGVHRRLCCLGPWFSQARPGYGWTANPGNVISPRTGRQDWPTGRAVRSLLPFVSSSRSTETAASSSPWEGLAPLRPAGLWATLGPQGSSCRRRSWSPHPAWVSGTPTEGSRACVQLRSHQCPDSPRSVGRGSRGGRGVMNPVRATAGGLRAGAGCRAGCL